jgi:hypothetical protein
MKFVGLLAALAVVYLVGAQMLSTGKGTKDTFGAAEAEAVAMEPAKAAAQAAAATPAPPATAGASLRRPLDRARQLNGTVSQRNGSGEF